MWQIDVGSLERLRHGFVIHHSVREPIHCVSFHLSETMSSKDKIFDGLVKLRLTV